MRSLRFGLVNRRRPTVVSLIPGRETLGCSGPVSFREATAVAVDDTGRAVAFGAAAVPAAAERRGDLRLVQPYSAAEVRHPDLAAAYLRWMATRLRIRPHRSIVAPVVPAAPEGSAAAWEALSAAAGFETFTVSRPVAIAAGLHLDIDATAGHMILELRDDGVEVAIVANGELVLAHHAAALAVRGVATRIRSLLAQVDPDLEWDITGTGIHAIGSPVSASWFRQLAEELDVPLVVSDVVDDVMLAGTRETLDLLDPVVTRGRQQPGWFRAVPALGRN